MRSALAIAAVSAVMKHMLENGLAAHDVTEAVGSDVLVSAQPPDRIDVEGDERAQVNLFLYLLTPNTAMRRAAGEARPLALDLHYMVSAYGASDLVIEALLGAAVRVLHQAPSLDRAQLAQALGALSGAGGGRPTQPTTAVIARAALAADLAAVQIVPQFPTLEDASKLWSALQARYRTSAYYKVSMALIEP